MLEGRTIVVSGVGPGLGRAIALACAGAGAAVVMGARTRSKLDEVLAEMPDGARAIAVETDVADTAACERIVQAAVDTYGGVDGVVNNAFWLPPNEPVAEITESHWAMGFDVNVVGPWRLVRAALPALTASGRGAVVNVSSLSQKRVQKTLSVYSATKAALSMLTDSLALELGERGIRVNGVLPGSILGPGLLEYVVGEAKRMGGTHEEMVQRRATASPLGRLVTPEEIAQLIVFLLSDLASGISGAHVDVDSGIHLGNR